MAKEEGLTIAQRALTDVGTDEHQLRRLLLRLSQDCEDIYIEKIGPALDDLEYFQPPMRFRFEDRSVIVTYYGGVAGVGYADSQCSCDVRHDHRGYCSARSLALQALAGNIPRGRPISYGSVAKHDGAGGGERYEFSDHSAIVGMDGQFAQGFARVRCFCPVATGHAKLCGFSDEGEQDG